MRENINERLKRLRDKLGTEEFMKNRGLGNEVPFYIFDYDPANELNVRNYIKRDLLPFYNENDKVKITEINLYELMIYSLKQDKVFDSTFKLEKRRGTEKLFESLKKSFNFDVITRLVVEKAEGKNIVLITGVGTVFPIVRTHAVLNNLQKVFNEEKVILFFPGEYTGEDLQLLGFKDNNYYRAFRI